MPKARVKSRQSVGSDKVRKKLPKMFNGVTEEEIRNKMTLPDILREKLDLVFVGINPGLYSAYRGHYYSLKGNNFWPCLTTYGVVPKSFGPDNDADCLSHNIGMTDIVKRSTRNMNELCDEDFAAGKDALVDKIRRFKPLVVVFNGKTIFSKFCDEKLKDVKYGYQGKVLEGCETVFYVMSNTSPLNAHYPSVASFKGFFDEIKDLVAKLKKSPYFS